MKKIQFISWFLGISMFMVGFLKFFNPFKKWYSVQISASELGNLSYVLGIFGEIVAGIILIIVLLKMKKLPLRNFSLAIVGTSLLIVIMMLTGIYVHMHPAVPENVLPLNIKPPYIPAAFLVLGLLNIALMYSYYRSHNPKVV